MLKKTPILLLLLPALCPCVLFAQYSLSARVGEVIDQYEREYFYLFPQVSGFTSAKTVLRGERTVDIIISRKLGALDTILTYSISKVLADHLGILIDGFESVRQAKATVNWDLLGSLAWNGPATASRINDGGNVSIVKHGGEEVSGKLMWADDSLVILWQSSDDFNWRVADRSTTVIRYSDIESISTTGEGKFWSGFGVGALIGGVGVGGFSAIYSNAVSGTIKPEVVLGFTGVGALAVGLIGALFEGVIGNSIEMRVDGNPSKYFYNVLPILRKKQVFPDYPPPELTRQINASARKTP
ncbi:MAG: hypothetical protein ABI778_00670 [Ignavibacteriota bacterium]